VHSWKTEWCSP